MEREGLIGICDDTGAEPRVSEEVIQENVWYCGGGCVERCDIERAVDLALFFTCVPPVSLIAQALTCSTF